ncbi:TPA: MAE_28990/MAE_18760 family HEPN-like nuclease [Serratia marcescens]
MHLPYLKYSDGRVLKSNSEEINAFQNDNNEKSIVGYSLNTIMKVRNKLAHGDLSFEEYGRSLVTDDLEKYYKDALFFLRMVILKVNYFISKEKYKP